MDTQNKRDFALQLVEVLTKKESPSDDCLEDEYNPKKEKSVGTMPIHLRHLHIFAHELKKKLDEINAQRECAWDNVNSTNEEYLAQELKFRYAFEQFDSVRQIFQNSLLTHFPILIDVQSEITICKNWKIVYNKDELELHDASSEETFEEHLDKFLKEYDENCTKSSC